jgi:phenylpyruvate tautomerase PptA (4-oxalocrotonate tautomerase family)
MPKGIRFVTVAVSLTLATAGLTFSTISPSGAQSHPTAKSDTAKAITSTVQATYKLNPEAVHLSVQDVKFQTVDHTVAQSLSYTGATPLAVGNIIVVDTTTGPFYGTVTAINGERVTTVPATLGDIFETLILKVTASPGITSSGGTTVGTGSGGGAAVASTKARSGVTRPVTSSGPGGPPTGPPAVPLLSATCSGSISPTVNVTATPSAGTFVLNLNFGWAGGLKSATLTDSPSFAITASAAVSGNGNCNLSQQIFNVELDPIVFAIGWVPVWITQSISGDLTLGITADGSASMSVGYKANATFGVAKPQGGSWGVVRTGSVTKTVNSTANINATVTLDLAVNYEAALYGLGGLGVQVDPFADLAVDVSPPVCKPLPWLHLSAGVNGSIYALINFGSLYSWNHTFATANFFTTDLINKQNVCPPITTHLNISTVANAIQTSFVPSLPSGNVIPLNSTVIMQDLAGTLARYFISVSNPNNSANAFNVKWYKPHSYVLTHSGTYLVKIEGGTVTNGQGSISKQITITVP